MSYRSIFYEHLVADQLKVLGVEFSRFDELMRIVEETLCNHPEMFPVLRGTKISLCKTNEFAGNQFQGVPSLAIYFRFDIESVYVLSIERNSLESYGSDEI